MARFAPAGVWRWIHGRADRPIAEHHYSILDSVLRLKLIFTSLSLSYLSLYIIAHLTVLPETMRF